MALYRCASCGSKNVKTDVQNGGIKYDYKKGIVGTVVLGVGGAVAGISSDSQTVYKCADCGITLTYSLPKEYCEAIEKGLRDATIRKSIPTSFGNVSWTVLKSQFKNIEDGIADREIASRNARNNSNLMEMATATKEEFDNAVDLLMDYKKRLGYKRSFFDKLPENAFSDEMPMAYHEYFVWQDAIATFIENVARYIPEPLPQKYRDMYTGYIQNYFLSYLHEKIRVELGRYPEHTGSKICKDYSKVAEKYPFVLSFADKYIKKRFSQGEPWNVETISELEKSYAPGTGETPTMCMIIYKFPNTLNSSDKEIVVIRNNPRFFIENGRIGFWYASHPKKCIYERESKKVMEYYFNNFPDEKKTFDERVAEHVVSLQGKATLEKKIEADKRILEEIRQSIFSKVAETTKLNKKIFGKKAALMRVTELENEIAIEHKKEQAVEMEINAEELKLKDILSDKDFYEKLVDDMNQFIAITWVAVQ